MNFDSAFPSKILLKFALQPLRPQKFKYVHIYFFKTLIPGEIKLSIYYVHRIEIFCAFPNISYLSQMY